MDHEVHAKDQVPLLMDMKKADVALDKAIESGDPQLGKTTFLGHIIMDFRSSIILFLCSVLQCVVYKVLEELKYRHYHSQMDRYLQLFHHRPVAAALYRKVCNYAGCV